MVESQQFQAPHRASSCDLEYSDVPAGEGC